MIIRALFFGATADEVGGREMDLAFDENVTADSVLNRLTSIHPNLKKHKLLFAVNQEYVSLNHSVKDGDEIAIFTAVSGG